MTLTNEQKIQFLDIIIRHDFKTFVLKVFNEVSPQDKYQDNWHVDVICAELEAMLRGENNRLIVNIPPRYMKSIICSVAFPAFILGHYPKESIVCVSYADELSKKLAMDCRRIMETEWYKRVFPFSRLAPTHHEIMDFETKQGGGRYSTTICGTLTGRGGNWIIIDDPIKPADANSDVLRKKVNDWYGNTLYSRLNDKKNGKILLIMQRTHEQDLTGYLLESKVDFKHITMPLVAMVDEYWEWRKYLGNSSISYKCHRHPGELLHPAREGIEQIEQYKKAMGTLAFLCQCQQSPLAPGGNIVKWEWFKSYSLKSIFNVVHIGDYPEFIQLIFSWDLAIKTGRENDYSVCICALKTSQKYYIVDIQRWKLELPALIRIARDYIEKQRKLCRCVAKNLEVRLLIEDVGCGIGFQQGLKSLGFRIDPIHPQEDKEVRLKNVTPILERGDCLLPDMEQKWLSDFKHEILGFPNTKHDDQVDALSQLLEFNKCKIFDWI